MTIDSRIPRIEVYRDALGKWRWHVRAGNGKITEQGQAHSFKWNAKRAARKANPLLPVVTV